MLVADVGKGGGGVEDAWMPDRRLLLVVVDELFLLIRSWCVALVLMDKTDIDRWEFSIGLRDAMVGLGVFNAAILEVLSMSR